MRIALLLVGFGNVARRFATLLEESKDALAAIGIEPFVVGITTRRHGGVFDAAGIEAARIARAWTEETLLAPLDDCPTSLQAIPMLDDVTADAHVVIETTTLNIRDGEPAISHVRAAFLSGSHVITANKGPAAFAYRALRREANEEGRQFLFEGAVMDGIPVFGLVRETMPAVTIHGFRGVVNSTTNHILTALEQGEPFEQALARMQADGVAEADPSLDIDGWDAAAKIAALANVWLDAGITPHDVRREGVSAETLMRVQDAHARGRRLKLVGRAARTMAGVEAAVELQELETSDPLGGLDGQGNAIEIDTWPLGRVVITQRDGGLEKTAYALIADLCSIAREVRRG